MSPFLQKRYSDNLGFVACVTMSCDLERKIFEAGVPLRKQQHQKSASSPVMQDTSAIF